MLRNNAVSRAPPRRQGNDVGPQYRSIILYHSEQQRETAEQMIQWVGQQGWYSDPVVTELVKATVFYPGEDYHQVRWRLATCRGGQHAVQMCNAVVLLLA